MKIKWFGHSSFAVEDGKMLWLTDPFDGSVGYPIPNVRPAYVTESHQHFDHNAHDLLEGDFEVVKDVGVHEREGIRIEGLQSYHDEKKGNERGSNIIFKVRVPSSVIFVHLGDLGHMLDDSTVKSLKDPDVLMVPVGGIFTIDAKKAKEIVDRLNPHLILPMHYETRYLKFKLDSVEDFTYFFRDVEHVKGALEIDPEELKEMSKKVMIFDI